MIIPNSRDLLFIHDCIVSNPILELLLRKLCCYFCEDCEICSAQRFNCGNLQQYGELMFFYNFYEKLLRTSISLEATI